MTPPHSSVLPVMQTPQFAFYSSKCLLYSDPPAADLCILLIVCLASARQCRPCRQCYLPGGPEKMSTEQDRVKRFPFHVVPSSFGWPLDPEVASIYCPIKATVVVEGNSGCSLYTTIYPGDKVLSNVRHNGQHLINDSACRLM